MSRRVQPHALGGDELYLERIPMPGCPAIVVTRGFAVNFLRESQYSGGWLSIERMCISPQKVERPITPSIVAEPFLAAVRRRIRELEREAHA